MRRVFLVVVLGCAACGALLGGDEDAPVVVTPAADGGDGTPDGAPTQDAQGLADAACVRKAISFADAGSVDAALDMAGWNKQVVGNTTMDVAGGRLVMTSTGVAEAGNQGDESNISIRVDGTPKRVVCRTIARLSTFDGEGRFIGFRIFAPQWPANYEASIDWKHGNVVARVQPTPTENNIFDNKPAPPPNTDMDVVAELVFGPSAQFNVDIGNVSFRESPVDPGMITGTRSIVGTFTAVGEQSGPYTLQMGDIACDYCF